MVITRGSRSPSIFLAAAMRPSNTEFLRWCKQDKRDSWGLKLRKRFRMWQSSFEHGINSLPFVCFRGYGNLSTLIITIPRLAFGRAWCCDAACGWLLLSIWTRHWANSRVAGNFPEVCLQGANWWQAIFDRPFSAKRVVGNTNTKRLLTHWGRVTHICVSWLDHQWFR